MGLQFVIGGSGSGKSYYVQHKVVQEAAKNPGKQYLFLVPDQFTMQTQKDLVLTHTKGIMNIDVLSFGRLSHRLFEENGGNDRPVLDDTGKSLILRKVAGEYEEKLPVIGAHLKKTGYIHEVKSALSEFYQYGIDQDKMQEMIAYSEKRGALCYKLRDLSTIYDGFNHYIEDKFITKEEILDQAARCIRESKILKDAVVVLDGFTGFTPVQKRFLQELFSVIDSCIVTVTMDADIPLDYPYEEQFLFAMSMKMMEALERIGKETGFARDEDVRLLGEEVIRFQNEKSLAFLEKEMFRYNNKSFSESQEAISIYEVDSPQNEIHQICALAQKLVMEKGYSYRDMALVTGALSDYEYYIEEECRRMGIPLYMDHTAKLSANAAMDYVLAALQVIKSDFAYEDLFHFLRSPFSPLTQEEVDELENYCLEKGIRGRKKYERMFTAKPSRVKNPEDLLETFNAYRERVIRCFEMLDRKQNTVEGFCRKVYDFMLASSLQEKCKELEENFTEENDLAKAKEYGQVYRILVGLLDQFVSLLGEEKMEFSEYVEILKAGIDECKVGTIPQNVDRFVAGDVERTRLSNIKVLFFAGINDGIIPKKGGNGGIINDIDREFLCEGAFEMAPSPRQKMYIQRFYLYLNMTKPQEKLILSYSKTSADGKTLRPSYLVETMKKMYPSIHIKTVLKEDFSYAYDQIRSKNDAMNLLSHQLREYSLGSKLDTKRFYALYDVCKEDGFSEWVEEYTNAAFVRYEGLPLKKEIVKSLYKTMLYGSVSRFEQFANCAYRYFLQYGLKLSEREGFAFEAKDLGTVYHSCLENFSNQLQKEKLSWMDFSKEQGEAMVDRAIEEVAATYHDTILYSSARSEYAILRMKRIMRRTVDTLQFQLKQGAFFPSDFELSFDSTPDPNLRMSLSDGTTLRLDGRIDRIDVCENDNQVYVKVVDYKSGNKDFQLAELYYGTQLQLVIYMNAALSEIQRRYPDKEVVPAAMFYYQMKDPMVSRKEEESEATIENDIRTECKPKGVVLADDRVVAALDAGFDSKSLVIPVEYNKDGNLSAKSSVYTREEIDLIERFVNKKIREFGEEIMAGNIRRNPCKADKNTSCDYCNFKGMCGFDLKIPGVEMRELPKLKDDEVMEKIAEALGEVES